MQMLSPLLVIDKASCVLAYAIWFTAGDEKLNAV